MKMQSAIRTASAAIFITALLSGPVSAQGSLENLLDLGRLPYLKKSTFRQIASTDMTGGNADRLVIAAGETAVLADIPGPGVITRIWITISSSDPHYLRRIVLRMYWDDEQSPSVEVPVGDFFGTGFDKVHYVSYFLGVSSGGFYSYWPMPFRRRARLEVVNETGREVGAFYYQIDYQQMHEPLDEDIAYFHAQWRREVRTDPEKNYTILEAEGRGHLVGVNMSMQGYNGQLWFLEGDEMVYVDGETEPCMYGTGTEDYFTSGWYFNEGTFAGPFHGLIIKDEEQARIAAYRYHLGDTIPFTRSLRFTIEHGHANSQLGDYSSTAYWYQMEPHALFPEMLPANARLPLRVLVPAGALEGEDLRVLRPRGSGALVVEDMRPYGPDWSGGSHAGVDLDTAGPVGWELSIDTTDLYTVALYLTRGPRFGTVRFLVNGELLGDPVDCNAVEIRPSGRIELGSAKLVPGGATLHVEAVGPNPVTGGRLFGLDAVSLEPVMNFITEWQAIGPFDNPRGEEFTVGLDIPYPPEEEVDLEGSYTGMNGQRVEWKLLAADPSGYVDLDPQFTPNEQSLAYAAVWVWSPDSRRVDCFLGTDDWVGLWLNGQRVHANVVHRGAQPDQDHVMLSLNSGWNLLLIKVGDDYGAWGFYLRISDPDEVLQISRRPYVPHQVKGSLEECTIGIATGEATSDGRPMIWKTRDQSGAPNNEVIYNTEGDLDFVCVSSAGSPTPWMGLNERGFAILNSQSSDLGRGSHDDRGDRGPGNGRIMLMALMSCSTVAEFEQLLDRTNETGRTTQANLAVMDTTGAVAIFETADSTYWKFDAHDPAVAPDGYILRTNFAVNGGGRGGIERYHRTVELFEGFQAENNLNYRSILRTQMRDFSNEDSEPVSVPYPESWSQDVPRGYIYTGVSICRSSSVSAAVFQGVRPGEPARLSTMWAMLGQPATSITIPYWAVGMTPPESDGQETAPLCDVSNQIRSLLFDSEDNSRFLDSYKLRDSKGRGLWTVTFAAEDSILSAAEALLEQWRVNAPTTDEILEAESAFAGYAFSILKGGYRELVTLVPEK